MPLLGGIRPPIALLCVLILALAGLTAKVLGPGSEPVVPKAVLSSQQYFAEDGAIALRASIDERVTDLERTAAALNTGKPADPERVLSDLSKAYQKWTGTTVLDLADGKVLAARGERIPLAWVDKDVLTGDKALTPRMVRLETGDVRLMTMAVLEGKQGAQQLLVASNSLSVPPINLGPFRSMAVVARGGEILATAGFEQSEALNSDAERKELTFLQKQMTRLSDQAAEETEQNPVSAREPGSRGYPGVSGTLVAGATTAGSPPWGTPPSPPPTRRTGRASPPVSASRSSPCFRWSSSRPSPMTAGSSSDCSRRAPWCCSACSRSPCCG
ncbi:hypothetical protein GA0115255_1096724 [Streptomyces sp. Ncost-T6T-2b]|nr:hypothetical protein GA0115255_1096724 [Streptomyces sp. Ncost-T6T-2b]